MTNKELYSHISIRNHTQQTAMYRKRKKIKKINKINKKITINVVP